MSRALKVNLIARDNGFGLTRDIELLRDALLAHGCEIAITRLEHADERRRWKLGKGARALTVAWRHRWAKCWQRPRFDLNIMFEHLWPEQLALARHNVALPNPEWFDEKDLRHLRRLDRVWAKTRHAQALFEARGVATSWIGFDSADHYEPSLPRRQEFFHLAGGSRIKGTERLLALWRRHPEWPRLTVLQHPDCANPGPPVANIDHRASYLSYAEPAQAAQLRELQNSHRFHLCTSETDGWGHYAIEALGVAAVVLTVDAPPMNELISADRGVQVAADAAGQMGMSTIYRFDEAALERQITELLSWDESACAALGDRARAWFLANQADFAGRVGRALELFRP